VRYITPNELVWIGKRTFERVFYILDDVVPIAKHCPELPPQYRAKLVFFARTLLPEILALQPTIVAPNEDILALFPGRPRELLDPCCLTAANDFGHFSSERIRSGPIRMAFLATRSHTAGIDFLVPVLEQILPARRDIRCTLFLGRHAPMRLQGLTGVELRAPLPWPEFRGFLEHERFHIMLAPLPETPFNRGRSITKLMDTAAVGAAGIFSDRTPFSRVLVHGQDGLLLPDDPQIWYWEIDRLASDLEGARILAEKAGACARRLGKPERVRQFWMQRLGLGEA
jgi:hypothetical protein